jgi:hypothetical protein
MKSFRTVIGVTLRDTIKSEQHEAAGNKQYCGRYTTALKGINIWKE